MKQGLRWFLALAIGWAGIATAASTPMMVANFDGSVPSGWTWGGGTSQTYVLTPMVKGVEISGSKGPGGGGVTFWGNDDRGYATWSVAFMADIHEIPEDGILWSTGDEKNQANSLARLFLVRGTGENKDKLCVITGDGKTLLMSSTDVAAQAGFRHITVTSDAERLRLYVDGKEVASSTTSHVGIKNNVQIARGVNNTTGAGAGKHAAGVNMIVDAFWGYGITLTAAEVRALANAYATWALAFASPEEAVALRAPLTEAKAVYDDFEGALDGEKGYDGYDYKWNYSHEPGKIAMPVTAWSKQGILTNASNVKPGAQYLPFVGTTKEATVSAWTVSVYGVLSCRDDAGIWGFAQPSNENGNHLRVNLVRRPGNVLAVEHGTADTSKEWRTLLSATVEGLDTDSRLYTVTSDGATLRLFVDGVEEASATPAAEDLVVHANWQVGVLPGGKPVERQGVHFSDGMALDAVALQGRALSNEEIAGLARLFPRVEGMNVAVPEVAYPEGWKIKAVPSFARAYDMDATDASAYRRLRELGVATNVSGWYVGALTAGGVNAGGPGAGDGNPAALILQGGAAQALSGATYNPAASSTYKGDTLVEVKAPLKVSYLVGGIGARSNTPSFEGNSLVRVLAFPEAYSTGAPIIAGGSADVYNSSYATFRHTGDATLEVTLGEEVSVSTSATFCGGGYDGWGGTSVFTGKSSLVVEAPHVTFAGRLVAGSGGGNVTHTGDATLTLKAGTFTGSLLPHEAKTFNGTSTLAIEGDIDFSQATVGAFDVLTLNGTLTLGEKRLPNVTLSAPIKAVTLTFTPTEAELASKAPIVLCRTDFDMLPETFTVSPTAEAEGWEARVLPTRQLAYAPVYASHVWAEGDMTWGASFADWKDGDVATFEAPAEGATRTITLGADVTAEHVIFKGCNALVGTGTLVADGVTLEDGATLALPKETASGFKYVRLTLSKTQGNKEMGIAEFILTKGGEAVPWPQGTTITTNGAEPDWTNNQGVNALIDSVYGSSTAKPAPINPKDGTAASYTEPASYLQTNYNKWMLAPVCVAIIELGEKVEADGYTLWSSDVRERMPAAWTLEVSDDGETWWLFDGRTGVSGAKSNTAYDYLARGEARLETDALILGEGVTLDLSQGVAPLVANAVRGTGGTVVLPTGGVSARVPFLVTPITGLTFTIKDDPEAYYRVVYADGAYCVEPYTLTMPLAATVTANSAWADLPWKDAGGFAVPARFWADETFVPDMVLTFGKAKAKVTGSSGQTVGELTVTGEPGQLVGTAKTPLKMGKLVVNGKLLVQAILPEEVSIAAEANLTVDVGGGSSWQWTCPIAGEGLLLKRGGGTLTLTGVVSVPRIVHGWSTGSTLVLEQSYEGAILFSSGVAQGNNFLYDGSSSTARAGGGGTVTIAAGKELTLTACDVEGNDAIISGDGTLVLPEGATLDFKDAKSVNASGLASVTVEGDVTVKVAKPSVGTTLITCKANATEAQADRLRVEGDWYAKADGAKYLLAALPTPAEGTDLESETLRTLRLAAAKGGLANDFAVKASGKGTPANVLTCFTGLPLETSAEDNSVTVRCDFGVAELRPIEDGTALLLKAQILNGAFAEGAEVEVLEVREGETVPAEGVTEIEAERTANLRCFRVPLTENVKRLTIRVTR